MELLIVIAIIGILISVSVVSYTSVQRKGRDSRRLGDMKSVQNAFEQYYADHNSLYPTSCALLDATYLPMGYPVDPKNSGTYVYGFHCAAAGTSYCLCAHLEETGKGNASADQDATCTFSSGDWYCVGNMQ